MPFSPLRMFTLAAALAIATLPALAQISINEILAEGRDQDGRLLPDWIELYNAGNQPVNLAGYSLTDNPDTPRKWVVPANVNIPANGFRRIFLDSDRAASAVAEKDLNAGFGLKSTGDQIELYSPSTLVESVRFGPQAVNYSLGKVPAGSASFVLCTPTPDAANVQQSLGPLRDLRINEWMASPSSGKDWFELYNPGTSPVQLTGLYFTDDGNAPSPVAPLSYLGIDRYGFLRIYANNGTNDNEVNFKLSGSGDSISLFTVGGTPLDSVHFLQQTANISQGRLPDGSGNIKSLTAATPGESNLTPYPGLVVNELLSHTDPPLEDAVEFYNQSDSPIDLSGWYLSNQRSVLKKFRVPNGTVIQPKGYVVFYEYQFNKTGDPNAFTFNSAHGDQVYLSQVNAAGEFTGYVVSERFESAENGVSFGHYETSVPGDYKFVPLEQLTFGSATDTLEHFRTGTGAPNSKPMVGPVVINEIMYHPPSTALDSSDNELDEFIELRNLTAQSVPLFDPLFPDNHWRLQNAVEYTFPRESLPALGYALVVSFDPSDSSQLNAFRQKYGIPANVQIFGPYSGKLNNGGDPVELYRPDTPQQPPHPDAGYVPYLRVDKVNYSATAPWPTEADNTGKSLQRKNSSEFGNDPINWQAAAPTAGKSNSGEVSDSDGDGLPDVWEVQNGFDPQNPADAALDSDNDGLTNLQEFLAGTNPRDPVSKVSLTLVSVSDIAGTVLSFPSVPGKSYSVQYRNNLLPSTTWQKLMNVDAVDNQTTLDDPSAGGKTVRFYRLVTPAVD
jgi:hypothetical protein